MGCKWHMGLDEEGIQTATEASGIFKQLGVLKFGEA